VKIPLILLAMVLIPWTAKGQDFKISGNWTGILTDTFNKSLNSYPVILQVKAIGNSATGVFRIEKNGNFYQYVVNGDFSNLKDFSLQSASKPSSFCKGCATFPFQFSFKYDDSSGYVIGGFTSEDPDLIGKTLVMEKDPTTYELGKALLFDPYFAKRFAYNIRMGISSKERRKQELKTFQFEPIYFAYDRYELDSSYHNYLKRVAKVVLGHSDLRIKITGNTDGDGSNAYNIHLSEQRAKVIQAYLKQCGVSVDRIVIEYVGETNPIDRNDNEQGKQRNRRVEICFI